MIRKLRPLPSHTYPTSLFFHNLEYRLQLTLNGDYRYVRQFSTPAVIELPVASDHTLSVVFDKSLQFLTIFDLGT